MQYKDLSNFTWGEMRHFTYADLTLGKLELYVKTANNPNIPDEIKEKLRILVLDVLQHHPELKDKVHLPAYAKEITAIVVSTVLIFLKDTLKEELPPLFHEIIKNISDLFS